MSNQYPETWSSCEIGEVAKIVGGATPSSKDKANFTDSDGIPWITPADLSGYEKIFIGRGARNLSEKGFASCSAAMLPTGAVLFSSRAPVGYVAIASNPVCTNQGFKSFVLPEGINSKFIYYYLRHIKPVAEARATGTTFKELSGSAASRLPLIVAPTKEQKRIADKLDTILAKVDTCRKRLNRVSPILKRFRQAVLTAAISGKLTEDWRANNPNEDSAELVSQIRHARQSLLEAKSAKNFEVVDIHTQIDVPSSWSVVRVGEISSYVTSGSRGWSKYYSDKGGAYFIRSAEINTNALRLSEAIHVSLPDKVEGKRALVEEGDLLVTITGANVGKCAVVTQPIPEAYVSQSVALIKTINKGISQYLHYWLQSEDAGGAQLAELIYGIGRPVLSLPQISSLKVGLPPLLEQNEIVRRVESLFAYTDQLEARSMVAHNLIKRLTPALLTKAFQGELVPQDPSDEPASILLERIRSTRARAAEKRHKKIKSERKLMPARLTSDTLKEIVRSLPKDNFTFDDLREKVSADYETIKDCFLDLLSGKPASVKQVFDKKAKSMRFERVGL